MKLCELVVELVFILLLEFKGGLLAEEFEECS
jgi:hypothetical protein